MPVMERIFFEQFISVVSNMKAYMRFRLRRERRNAILCRRIRGDSCVFCRLSEWEKSVAGKAANREKITHFSPAAQKIKQKIQTLAPSMIVLHKLYVNVNQKMCICAPSMIRYMMCVCMMYFNRINFLIQLYLKWCQSLLQTFRCEWS